MHNLAAAHDRAGKLDLAVPLYEETLKLRKAKLGADHPETIRTMAALGRALLMSKAVARAEPVLRECLAISEKARPDDWQSFNARSLLGGALLAEQNYSDAEALLLKGYEGMKQREKAIPHRYANSVTEALDRLIELYAAVNKPDEVKKWQAERAKYSKAALPPEKKT
jgi:hypothetical protein